MCRLNAVVNYISVYRKLIVVKNAKSSPRKRGEFRTVFDHFVRWLVTKEKQTTLHLNDFSQKQALQKMAHFSKLPRNLMGS